MGNEFQDMSTTPTLTLDPFQAQEQKKPPVAQQEEPALDDSVLDLYADILLDSFADTETVTADDVAALFEAYTEE